MVERLNQTYNQKSILDLSGYEKIVRHIRQEPPNQIPKLKIWE
jgi:hypothetical protein